MNCREWRTRREKQPPQAALSPSAEEHLRACPGCAEYERLRQWSSELLRQGELPPPPGNFGALWTAIQARRPALPRWDLDLLGSFRRLAPFLVAVSLLFFLVGAIGQKRPGVAVGFNSQQLLAGSNTVNLAPDLSRQGSPEAVLVSPQP